ncbi:hypothetical protein [Alkalihalobacillus sp. CinArs1]|uniref:hypothetical protein n=1 Tax=Alkalihalobacillus sp. CinArs1 TaxID=2995314 RepID=UPI0022DD8ABA|nr:hypothetical protein [Alkalihalobacillus sp. CinArs1]
MKKLNLYKIVGILITFGLFLVIFNFLQNREPNFEVNSKAFDVVESAEALDDHMNQMIPQFKLAKELDLINTYNKSIPILDLDRELIIHEAMVVAYGGIYLSYSFSLKEEDMPFDLPQLSIGSISYRDGSGAKKSEYVEQHLIQSQKPIVNEYRLYQAVILTPESNLNFITEEEMDLLNLEELTLKDIVVSHGEKKKTLNDVTLKVEKGYKGTPFAEADLDQALQVGDGTIEFEKFTASYTKNKLYFESDLNDLSYILVNEQVGDHTFQNRYKVENEGDRFSITMQPFQELQEKLNLEIAGILRDKTGSVESTLSSEELTKLKDGGVVEAGNYGGVSYGISMRARGSSHALALSLEAQDSVEHDVIRMLHMINENEISQFPYKEDFITLSIKDRNGDDILIYDIEESDTGFLINLDMGHATSLSPVTVKLSYLPDIVRVREKVSASLKLLKK